MRENLDKAAYYRPSNLTAIIDVNRLGQRGPTKLEGDMTAYQRRAGASSSSTVIIAPRSESHVRSLQPTSSRHAAKRTPASVGTVSTHREWSIHCGPGIT